MNFKRIFLKTTCALIVLSCLFIYVGFDTTTPSGQRYSLWTQYGGGADQRLLADGNTAIIDIFMH